MAGGGELYRLRREACAPGPQIRCRWALELLGWGGPLWGPCGGGTGRVVWRFHSLQPKPLFLDRIFNLTKNLGVGDLARLHVQ